MEIGDGALAKESLYIHVCVCACGIYIRTYWEVRESNAELKNIVKVHPSHCPQDPPKCNKTLRPSIKWTGGSRAHVFYQVF